MSDFPSQESALIASGEAKTYLRRQSSFRRHLDCSGILPVIYSNSTLLAI